MSALGDYTNENHLADKTKEDKPVLFGTSQIKTQKVFPRQSKWRNLRLFFVVALLYYCWIVSKFGFSLTNASGDAHDIWLTITTWGTDEVHYSYVLYKGLFALQPYLWLYRAAVAFGLPDQSLVIAFFGLLYAYSSVYGFPAVVSQLIGNGKPVATWKRALFAVVLIQLTKYTYAYSELMVDLPSMASFLMLTHLAICLPEANRSGKQGALSYIHFLATGLCAGVCLSFSGQYSLAACCIIIFILIKLVRLTRASFPQVVKYAGVSALLFIVGTASIVVMNKIVGAAIAETVAASGAFCPSGTVWMKRSLYRNLQFYQDPGKHIPNIRLTQIAYRIYGEADAIQRFTANAMGDPSAFWSISDYLHTALKYPVDFICNWLNHFLYAISMDQWNQRISALLVSYTSLYIVLYEFVVRVKKWSNIFNRNFWIVVGFLCIAIPLMVMAIEPRLAISISGFFLSGAICGDILWQSLVGFFQNIQEIIQARSLSHLKEKKVPIAFLIWIVFVVVIFSWYAALMENCGYGTDILFHW